MAFNSAKIVKDSSYKLQQYRKKCFYNIGSCSPYFDLNFVYIMYETNQDLLKKAYPNLI